MIKLPLDAINIRYNEFGLCYDCMVAPEPVPIPNKKWQLIASLNNVTDEQAFKMGFCMIECFLGNMKRLEIYTENPYPKDWYSYQEWRKAEDRSGFWVILFEAN